MFCQMFRNISMWHASQSHIMLWNYLAVGKIFLPLAIRRVSARAFLCRSRSSHHKAGWTTLFAERLVGVGICAFPVYVAGRNSKRDFVVWNWNFICAVPVCWRLGCCSCCRRCRRGCCCGSACCRRRCSDWSRRGNCCWCCTSRCCGDIAGSHPGRSIPFRKIDALISFEAKQTIMKSYDSTRPPRLKP